VRAPRSREVSIGLGARANVRSSCRSASLAICGATCVMAFAILAPAAIACIPGRSNDGRTYFDGWYRTASSVPGGTMGDVHESIYELSPYVAGDVSAAWVMLDNMTSPPGYVQVGWIKYQAGDRHAFDEWTDSSGNWTRSLGAAFGVGGFTPYEVLWNGTAQRLQTYAGGALFGSHVRYFTIREAENFGEIHTLASQMPGTTNQHEQLTNAYVQNLSGSQYDFSGTVSNDYNFGAASGGSRRQDIWDPLCAT
jgi:hypothetical protein